MPVVMEQGASGRSFSLLPGVRCVPRREWLRSDGIAIGIVNNMPDAAMEATERQFVSLLATASDGVLSRSDEIGADIFIKERGSLFVFLQGHPEYDASTLLREYRRDVARFLRHERETFPAQPHRYFDQPSAQALEAFRIRAFADRSPDLMEAFPPTAVREPLISAWRASA